MPKNGIGCVSFVTCFIWGCTKEVLDQRCSEEPANKAISFNNHTVPAGESAVYTAAPGSALVVLVEK